MIPVKSPRTFMDYLPLFFFLLVYFVLALFTYRDFGIDWDEFSVYSRGDELLRFLTGKDPAVTMFLVKPAHDVVDGWISYSYWYPMLLRVLNPAFSFEVFHMLNIGFASLVFVCAYALLLAQYQSAWKALLGPVFLLLTPRFLGLIPFDVRDISFCVFYLLALTAIFKWGDHPAWIRVPVLGLLFGLAISLRLVGASLFFIWTLFYIFERMEELKFQRSIFFARDIFLVLVLSVLVMLPTWPYLREDFFHHLLEIIQTSRHFPMEVQFLFAGHMVSSFNLPWFYLPLWWLVSMPLFILVLAGGVFYWGRPIGHNRLLVFLLIALGVNLALVLALQPAVYLSARHFLYLVPLLVLVAALSAIEASRFLAGTPWLRLGIALLAANGAIVAVHLVLLHPYEYVYFNELTGGLQGAYGNYEIEERGTSAKEAVDWLKVHEWTDLKKTYTAACYQEPFQTIYYLPKNVKYELDKDKAQYLITMPFSGHHHFLNPRLYSVTREGVDLMDIYQK
ncbi:MAG TPA: hypothetical protein VK791_09705 [bacterium]|nr:hypothetical protein [bacterium]